ncbi:hypothetical protein TNCV_2923341 [Trichonephila clavipes]|nr:hypothetical protein TNCV_2923341 [Trichonephila clavipes]
MAKPGSSFTPTLLGHEDNSLMASKSTEEEPSTPTTEESTTATEPVIYLTQAPPNRLRMVMVDTRGLVTRLMVDNEESGTVTADLTINLSFQSDEV